MLRIQKSKIANKLLWLIGCPKS